MRRQTSGEALDRWLLAAEQTAGGKVRGHKMDVKSVSTHWPLEDLNESLVT